MPDASRLARCLPIAMLTLLLVLSATRPTVAQDDAMQRINPHMQPAMPIDQARVEASGIRRIEGKHITLYTDIRDDPSIDELPLVFDAAIEHWCRYFDVPPERTEGWRISGFIIQDRTRFDTAGLIPDDLGDFPTGLNRGHEMWILLQRGDYYTRHLWIHEGTHAFMQWFLRGTGAPWYSEGMAELLAVHRWEDGQLELETRLRNPEDAEWWGRPKVIRDSRNDGTLRSLADVFATGPIMFGDVEDYAWGWAACRFLSHHPLSRDAFANMQNEYTASPVEFVAKLELAIAASRATIDRDWQLYLAEQDYGFEIERGIMVESAPGDVGTDGSSVFKIRADHGWQLTDLHVDEGQSYRISGEGEFQVALEPVHGQVDPVNGDSDVEEVRAWICESGGVTIEYYRERPLGMLVAGVLDDEGSVDDLIQGNAIGHAIGLSAGFTPAKSGRLCFRINDSPARMDDNEGELSVRVAPADR